MTSARSDSLAHWQALFRRHWRWALAVAVVFLALLLWLRKPIADAIWSEARAEALRQQAETALNAGKLSNADGSGARELFEAGIAIDPDRAELRAGLTRVAVAAVANAERAIGEGRFADAHRHLELAGALSAPRARFDAAAERLREREAAMAGIDALLADADAARREGHLDGATDAALPLYRRILDLQPRHLQALEGREDALTEVLRQARVDLERGAVAEAATKIATATNYDSGHVELADAQRLLAQGAERVRRRAESDLRAGRLARAAEGFRRWQATGLDPSAAEQGLAQVARAHMQRARNATADFRFDQARSEIDAAQALVGETAESKALRRDLERKTQTSRTRAPTPAQRRRALALLREAENAEARGDWLTPPGESAYDKLRAARSLAPNEPVVERATAKLLPRVRACFDKELRDNRLQRARVCLDARAALEGESRALVQARRALAMRWLAVGDERIGRGEFDGAEAALEAARGLDAKTPGIDEFAKRVAAAKASNSP